ncbi:MAG: methyl-accepting chemotaxis protein [Thermoleophilia bacterium]
MKGRAGGVRLPRRGIGTKLIVLLLLAGLVPMAVVGVLSVNKASSSLREDSGQAVEELAFNASDKLDRNLFERYGDVQAFAKSDPAKSMDPQRLQTWIDTMMGTYTPIYNLMVVADASGKVVAANTADLNGESIDSSVLLGTDVSGEAWFQKATDGSLEDGQTFVEDLHVDALTQAVYGDGPEALAMNFTYPIRDDEGTIVGVWTNRFNWDVTTDILAAVADRAKEHGAETLQLTITSADGVVLAGGDPADVLQQSLAEDPVAAKGLVEGASGWGDGEAFHGERNDALVGWFRSAGYAVYPGVGWSIFASQDRSEALAAAGSLTTTTVITALVAALLLLGLAVVFARSISRPLGRIRAALAAVAQGRVDERVDVRSRDEIGEMAVAYRDMQAYLAEMTDAAGRIAEGDVSVETQPRSEHDVLGHAFVRMGGYLRGMAAAAGRISRGDLHDRVQATSEADALGNAFAEMQDYLETMADAATRIADGDLTVEVEPRSDADALGRSFLAMSENLRRTIGDLREAATTLANASRGMADTATESGRAVQEIAVAIEEVAQGAERQVRIVDEAKRAAEQVVLALEENAGQVEETAEASDQARSAADGGVEAVAAATDAMAAIRDGSAQATEAIRLLGEKSERIGGIVETITGIAEQTNLLALNAAIEAARAGEQGRGFAVVAEEVRKLAEESQAAAATIASLVQEIQGETAKAVDVVERTAASTSDGTATVEQAREAFLAIGDAVDAMSGRIAAVAARTREVALSADRMQQEIGDVVGVAEQSSAASEQVSASTEETRAATDEIVFSAQALSRTAGELESIVERFRL